MLLRVILKNFLSFDNEVQFDMFPNFRRTHLSSHIYTNQGVVPILKQAAIYGGNGSGKTTLLNIIGEKLHANKKSKIDKGNYFKLYVNECEYSLNNEHYEDIKMISSDDIFDYLF